MCSQRTRERLRERELEELDEVEWAPAPLPLLLAGSPGGGSSGFSSANTICKVFLFCQKRRLESSGWTWIQDCHTPGSAALPCTAGKLKGFT